MMQEGRDWDRLVINRKDTTGEERVIGHTQIRKGGIAKVTGTAQYGSDVDLPGQLYAAVARSPYPHARILQINTQEAAALSGVRAVITGADCPTLFGSFIADQPIVAREKVRYQGEPVAAVAADTQEIAREAARLIQVEYEQFLLLREEVGRHIDDIQITADAMADLDVLLGLAEGAQQYRYCRPVLDNSMTLRIVNGRHPVIEQNVSGDVFVPNDAFLEPVENRLILLTGPNMAGKSTYIRQVALITLMAQIGAYVPAESAHIGLVDRIFCRVGASDDLARGQSTFMVEMSETSLILNNATERSLIILDEIGRGTATFDGLSIAWAVAEYLHDELKSRTLFATHYHELTDLANSRQGVQNYNVAVREWKEEIVFLRKIVPGAADKSYGIQVARLAGMPAVIVDRAKAILSHLEMNSTRPRRKERSRLAEPRAKNTDMEDDMPAGEYAQLELF